MSFRSSPCPRTACMDSIRKRERSIAPALPTRYYNAGHLVHFEYVGMTAASGRSRVLLVPGLGNSGPAHWQSLWEPRDGYLRVQQRDWDHPVYSEWIGPLERAVRE